MNKREALERILAGHTGMVQKYRKDKELDLVSVSAMVVCVDDDGVEFMPDTFSIQTGNKDGQHQSHPDCTMDDWERFAERVDTSHPKHRIFMLRIVKTYTDPDAPEISKDDFLKKVYK